MPGVTVVACFVARVGTTMHKKSSKMIDALLLAAVVSSSLYTLVLVAVFRVGQLMSAPMICLYFVICICSYNYMFHKLVFRQCKCFRNVFYTNQTHYTDMHINMFDAKPGLSVILSFWTLI